MSAAADNTKRIAYMLWELTRHENMTGLWYCAEDMAWHLKEAGIKSPRQIADIAQLDRADPVYIEFLRQIAFRIYAHTGREDAAANWYDAERLVADADWQIAVATLARIYRAGLTELPKPEL